MTHFYLAGPMSGYPELNFPAFHREAAYYRSLGHKITNPAEINGGAAELVACEAMTDEQLKAHWRKCMRKDIPALLKCEGILMMPGWERSKGASLEHHIARALDMQVVYLVREERQAA